MNARALLCVLALAAPATAADTQSSLFDQASEMQLAHQPKEAIALYERAISADRFDLPHSAAALVNLVACFQLLRDDPGQAARYREVSARWLTAPPPLDGKSTLMLDDAEEDLLWKPWPSDGSAKPMMSFAVDSAERTRSASDGAADAQLNLTLKATMPEGMPLESQGFSIGQLSGKAQAIEPNGTAHDARMVYLNDMASPISVFLQFPDLPATVTRLKRLSGTLSITLRKEWELKRVRLHDGEHYEAGDASWKITAVHGGGDVSVTMDHDIEPMNNAAQLNNALQAIGAAGAAGNGAGIGELANIWLEDAAGHRFNARGMSAGSDDHKSTMTLNFGNIALPPTLVYRLVSKTSTRDVPFSIDGVDLP